MPSSGASLLPLCVSVHAGARPVQHAPGRQSNHPWSQVCLAASTFQSSKYNVDVLSGRLAVRPSGYPTARLDSVCSMEISCSILHAPCCPNAPSQSAPGSAQPAWSTNLSSRQAGASWQLPRRYTDPEAKSGARLWARYACGLEAPLDALPDSSLAEQGCVRGSGCQ